MNDLALSIIIPVFNKFNFTKSCLADLSKLPNDHQIIVFDNGSTDETQKELSGLNMRPNFKYIRSDINGGFAYAINKAYAQTDAPNILMLNNDIRVKNNFSDWTKQLIEHCGDSLVGPTMGELNNNFGFIRETNQQLVTKYSYLSGWCLAGSKKIFDKLKINDYVGPMSEEFFCYFEDADMSMRAKQIGISLKIIDIPVVHFGKVSSKQLNTATLYQKAKIIFTNKWKNK